MAKYGIKTSERATNRVRTVSYIEFKALPDEEGHQVFQVLNKRQASQLGMIGWDRSRNEYVFNTVENTYWSYELRQAIDKKLQELNK